MLPDYLEWYLIIEMVFSYLKNGKCLSGMAPDYQNDIWLSGTVSA
jgi:hypothetical protein